MSEYTSPQESILFDIDEHGVATLRVNRPASRNALNWAAQERFAELVTAVSKDPTIRVLIVTGTGRAFISGADLKELVHHPEPAAGERLNRVMSSALHALTRLPIPVIAALNGDAVGGGCEIVTACDLRIASEAARLGYVQVRNGLTSGWGGTARLVNLVGQSLALEMVLTTRLLSAAEAQRIGLLHRLVGAEEDVLAAARRWAMELVALPRGALAAMKDLAYTAVSDGFEATQHAEAAHFVDLWPTQDHLEALTAFSEKRKPEFNQS